MEKIFCKSELWNIYQKGKKPWREHKWNLETILFIHYILFLMFVEFFTIEGIFALQMYVFFPRINYLSNGISHITCSVFCLFVCFPWFFLALPYYSIWVKTLGENLLVPQSKSALALQAAQIAYKTFSKSFRN